MGGSCGLRTYEAVLVLTPQLDEEGVRAIVDKAQQAVAQKGGTVERVDRWGKLRLAYEINHQREGHYVLLHVQAPEQGGTSELEHLCRISDSVLRFLVTHAVKGAAAAPARRTSADAEAAAPAEHPQAAPEPADTSSQE